MTTDTATKTKWKVDRKEFLEALANVATVVPAKSTKPILQNVKLKAQDNYLEMAATDLDVSVRYNIERVEVVRPGEVVVSAQKLLSIVHEVTDANVEFEVAENMLKVVAGTSTFRVVMDDPAEFPTLPEFPKKDEFTVPKDVIATMIRRTEFAAAKEQARYAFNGILFHFAKSKLDLVATDGKRLAWAKAKVTNRKKIDVNVIVPAKGFSLLNKVFREDDEKIGLNVTDNQILARTKRALVSCRLIEGQFPSYEDVVPSDCDKTIEFAVEELVSKLRQAQIMTDQDSRAVRLSFEPNLLRFSSQAVNVGESNIELKTDYAGEEFEVAFNPEYVLEPLKVLGEEKITISLKDGDTPGLIQAGETYTYIVMPIKLM
ncbi:MAG: DNA polymerase III subunit beta [Planctomycetota bacterium]|jgi:DNA polymerase-3 subunit beta